MILKKMIGNILKDLGFVTQTQLDEAVKKQKQIFKSKILPEKLNRTQLISEARISGEASSVPFLGEILTSASTLKCSLLINYPRLLHELIE